MKKLFFSSLFIILILPYLAYSEASIVFDSESYDVGEVKAGEQVEKTFVFTNQGTDELIITDVKSTWGCTAVVTSSSHLKTNEKGTIVVKVNTEGRNGVFSKSIFVKTNDPKRLNITLTLSMTVIKTP